MPVFPEKTEVIVINDHPGQYHHHHLHHHVHNHGHRPNSAPNFRPNHRHTHIHKPAIDLKKNHNHIFSHSYKPWPTPRHNPTVVYHHPQDHSNEHEHTHVHYDYSHNGIGDWEHHASNIHNFRVDKNNILNKEGSTNFKHMAVFNRNSDYNTLTTTSPDYESYSLRSRGLPNNSRNRNKELYFHNSFKPSLIRPTEASTVTWTPKDFALMPGNFTVGSLLF
nr:uncharacterized histidine-rich protein DDB_G0274557-like [Parasteatoda tepidariorum]